MDKIHASLFNLKRLSKIIVIGLLCASCTINKHGLFIGSTSQKVFNKTLKIEQKNDNIEVSYDK